MRKHVIMVSKKPSIDWPAWVRAYGVFVLGLVGVLVAFYYTTKLTLDKHEAQFAEVNKTFEKFNTTLQKNYDNYAVNQKEEAVTRDKMREQFMTLFSQLSISTAGTNAEVKAIGKVLDGVTTKLDGLSSGTTQNRMMIQKR